MNDEKWKFVKLGDVIEKIKQRPKHVKIEDDYIILLDNDCPYEIELNRIRNEKELLHWITHLTEKNWVTRELIHEFIIAVSNYHGFSPYGNE